MSVCMRKKNLQISEKKSVLKKQRKNKILMKVHRITSSPRMNGRRVEFSSSDAHIFFAFLLYIAFSKRPDRREKKR